MQVFASQEELGELCRILDEDLESYAGFLLPRRSLGSYVGF